MLSQIIKTKHDYFVYTFLNRQVEHALPYSTVATCNSLLRLLPDYEALIPFQTFLTDIPFRHLMVNNSRNRQILTISFLEVVTYIRRQSHSQGEASSIMWVVVLHFDWLPQSELEITSKMAVGFETRYDVSKENT